MKNKIVSFSIIIINLLFIVSCNDNKKSGDLLNQNIDPNINEFYFPDTTYIKSEVKGVLKYNLNLDSLDLSDIGERFVLFYLTKDKEVSSLDDVKKTKHDVFIDTIGNGVINFKMMFNNQGYNILSGVIEDKIIFKTPNEEGKIRIISKETSVSKKVYVNNSIKTTSNHL